MPQTSLKSKNARAGVAGNNAVPITSLRMSIYGFHCSVVKTSIGLVPGSETTPDSHAGPFPKASPDDVVPTALICLLVARCV